MTPPERSTASALSPPTRGERVSKASGQGLEPNLSLQGRPPGGRAGSQKLRDRDSNPNLPDQNRASLPIGLSRTVRDARRIPNLAADPGPCRRSAGARLVVRR